MVSLNDAWAILGDQKRRRAYDAGLKAAAAAATPATTADRATAPTTPSPRGQRATNAAGATAYDSAPWTAPEDKTTAPTEDLYAPAPAPMAPASSKSGTILDFGRYNGWSLVDLARQDPYYLEWLERTPIGRPMRSEIQALLEQQRATAAASAVQAPPRRRRWGR
jgi:uncharacterized protein (DUF3820 family)